MRRYLTPFFLCCLFTVPAHAIITLGGGGRLLTPPSGAYRESGFQFTGNWGGFVGTAIGPHHFITAAHVGGGVGNVFTLNDRPYIAEGLTVVKGTDLAVWRVKERFPQWAPLYDGKNETGKEIILYGRGCRRGRPIRSDGVACGWLWGETDGVLSWGRNRVEGVAPLPGTGEMLVFGFDGSGGEEEGTVGRGDSGGGVFMQDGTTWKLAGVNHASGGQYSRTKSGTQSFMAALYDARGFYQNHGKEWKQHAPYATDAAPTLAFATRVASHAAEIRAITDTSRFETRPLSVRTYLMIAAGFLVLVVAYVGVRLRRASRLRKSNSGYYPS